MKQNRCKLFYILLLLAFFGCIDMVVFHPIGELVVCETSTAHHSGATPFSGISLEPHLADQEWMCLTAYAELFAGEIPVAFLNVHDIPSTAGRSGFVWQPPKQS